MNCNHAHTHDRLLKGFHSALPDLNQLANARLRALEERRRAHIKTVKHLCTDAQRTDEHLRHFESELIAQSTLHAQSLSLLQWMWLNRHVCPAISFQGRRAGAITNGVLEGLIYHHSRRAPLPLADLIAWSPSSDDYDSLLSLWSIAVAILDARAERINLSLSLSGHIDDTGMVQIPDNELDVITINARLVDYPPACRSGIFPIDSYLVRPNIIKLFATALGRNVVTKGDIRARLFIPQDLYGTDMLRFRRHVLSDTPVSKSDSAAIMLGMLGSAMVDQMASLQGEYLITGGIWAPQRFVGSDVWSIGRQWIARVEQLMAPLKMDAPESETELRQVLCDMQFLDPVVGATPLVIPGIDFDFVDYHALGRYYCHVVASLTAEEEINTENDRSALFEDLIQEMVRSLRYEPVDAHTYRGFTLCANGKDITDIDACAEVDANVLLIISCKSRILRGGVLCHDYRERRNDATMVSDAVEQLRGRLKVIDTARRGDNYDLTRFSSIYGVVCTPYVIPPVPSTKAWPYEFEDLRVAIDAKGLGRWLFQRRRQRS